MGVGSGCGFVFLGSNNGGGGSGIDAIVVATANGFNGSVSGSSTAVISIGTTVNGIMKGTGSSAVPATASDITGQLLTGYAQTSGTISASDSILSAFGKITGQLLTGYAQTSGTISSSDTILSAFGKITGQVLTGYAYTSGAISASDTILSAFGKITGVLLTGYASMSGTITATDSILTAIGKLNGNIASISGAVIYQGAWNAATNTPTLTSSVGTKGFYYVVSVAGTTNLNGISSWQVNDLAIFNGSIWEKIANSTGVLSVNNLVGAVPLTGTANQISISSTNVFSFPSTLSMGTIIAGVWNGTTIAIANGGTGVTSVTTSPTANAWMGWDSNKNIFANNIALGVLRVAGSGTPISMTAASKMQQELISGSQTFNLPNATTLTAGWPFEFNCNSSGTITIKYFDGTTTLATVLPGGFIRLILSDNSSSNGVWDFHGSIPSASSWDNTNGITNSSNKFNGVTIASSVITGGTLGSTASLAGAVMAIGSDAPYDMYYRSAAGNLQRFPQNNDAATVALLTQLNGAAPVWATVLPTTALSGLNEMIPFEDPSSSIAAQTYTLCLYAFYGIFVNQIKIQSTSGTCTAAFQKNGVNITGLTAISVSSTIATATATAANQFAVGDILTMVITSPSSLTNLRAIVKTSRV